MVFCIDSSSSCWSLCRDAVLFMTKIEPCFVILSMTLYEVFERRFFLPPTAETKLRFLLVFERNMLCEFS